MDLASLRPLILFCTLALAGAPLQAFAAQSAPAPDQAATSDTETPAARPADVGVSGGQSSLGSGRGACSSVAEALGGRWRRYWPHGWWLRADGAY